jgi:hypothetical protein
LALEIKGRFNRDDDTPVHTATIKLALSKMLPAHKAIPYSTRNDVIADWRSGKQTHEEVTAHRLVRNSPFAHSRNAVKS